MPNIKLDTCPDCNKVIVAEDGCRVCKARYSNGKQITDGYGNYWAKYCPNCGDTIHVVRPGKVQCNTCG